MKRLPKSLEPFCQKIKNKIEAGEDFTIAWPEDDKVSPEIDVQYQADQRLTITVVVKNSKLIDNKYKEVIIDANKNGQKWKQKSILSDRSLEPDDRILLGLREGTANASLQNGINITEELDVKKPIAAFAVWVIKSLVRKKVCPSLYDLAYQTIELAKNPRVIRRLFDDNTAVPEPDIKSYGDFLNAFSSNKEANEFIHNFPSWGQVFRIILKTVKLEKKTDGTRDFKKEEKITRAALIKLHKDKLKYTPRPEESSPSKPSKKP